MTISAAFCLLQYLLFDQISLVLYCVVLCYVVLVFRACHPSIHPSIVSIQNELYAVGGLATM